MRQITSPGLTPELKSHYGGVDVPKAPAYPVSKYRDLVTHVARLAHENADHLLFYRGQAADYANKAGASTFYPSIYRSDPLSTREIESRFLRLRFQGQKLAQAFRRRGLSGADQLEAREVLQWSVIQHYEIGETPLLDLTHSLAVACSFALDSATGTEAYVYVFGLPHIANRISINSEHDIINVRLLSICPPDALRPYFQEGYLVGTWDVTDRYSDKTVLDFSRRLLAKFRVPTSRSFWESGFGPVPRDLLYPPKDRVRDLCVGLGREPDVQLGAASMGHLLLEWQRIERALMSAATELTGRTTNVGRAIGVLSRAGVITDDLAKEVDTARRWRNRMVHGDGELPEPHASAMLNTMQSLAQAVEDAVAKWRPER